MSKKDKEQAVDAFAATQEVSLVPEARAAFEAAVAQAPKQYVSFEAWAAHVGKKARHFAGMRAFCKTTHISRTVEEWNKIFEQY